MSNLFQIQAQRQDFRTAQNSAWTDGFPIIGQPGAGGVVAGSANIGNGGLVVASIDAGTALGVHVAAVTGIVGGLTHFTVTDPDGDVTGQGVVGLTLAAGGVTFTLAQGSTPFAVGDAFAIAVLVSPLDLTGIVFVLDCRMAAGSATYALQATSEPDDGSAATIAAGTTGGTIAMRLARAAMGRLPPGEYPYNVLAVDRVADPDWQFPVLTFCGLIRHGAVLQTRD